MASSPNNGISATETLNPPPFNANDLPNLPHQHQQHSSSESAKVEESVVLPNPQSESDAVTGDKRKREESENTESSLHPMYKTSLCSYFRRHGSSCSHGDGCRYAHGEEELRLRPDNTWDPTSDRAKKALKLENGGNNFEVRVETEVMMTDVVVGGGIGDRDGDGNGNSECVMDPELSKCLVHLPMKWDSERLKKFLSEEGVSFKSAKKKKGMAVGFVSFVDTEKLRRAMEELNGKPVGNKNIKVADVIPRSYEKNIKSAMSLSESSLQTSDVVLADQIDETFMTSDGVEVSDKNVDGSVPDITVPKTRSAKDVVTPLAHMVYGDQLEQKKTTITQMLKKLTKNARKACPNGVPHPEWVVKAREIGGLPCELVGILESPVINGYRNKCEFSVGYSLQGKATVGFMLGSFREGITAVEEPHNCPNVSTIACKFALAFQEFLQGSGLPVWNRFKNTGFWRQLTVREGRSPGKSTDAENAQICEAMLIVQVCSVGCEDALITNEFESLAKAFAAKAAADTLPLTVLAVQDHQGISNVAPADAPLRSLPIPTIDCNTNKAVNDAQEMRIHDYINNLKFSISPTAFFQVNTPGAEKLYSLAGDWAGLGPDTLLFDVCCGTGTIGLTLAHRVGMVIGIEMNAAAVQDAFRNAAINGIENCRFVCGKAEDVMGSVLKEYLNTPLESLGSNEPPNTAKSIPGEKSASVDDVQNIELPSILQPDDKCESECSENEQSSTAKSISGEECTLVEDVQNIRLLSVIEGDNKRASECSENGGQTTPQSIAQKSNCSSGGVSAMTQFKDIVAIVDPPRVGLHPIVIKTLRMNPRIRRLVYISCNPESLVANAIELCTPSSDRVEKGNKNNRGWRNMSSAGLARHRAKSMPMSEPFRPVKAMGVDLFPHTPHCEMVMLLER